MTEALPIGIITNTENISSDIEAIDRVDVEDIAQLWRVYSTNRVLLPHDAGRRLENLFWRILGNARIHQGITGSTVARLFLHISEGSDFLRTTPTQSPRGNRSGESSRLSHSPTPPRVTIQEDHVGATSADSDLEIRRGTRQPSDASRQALPPPILKKPRAGSDEPPKTARILSPKQTGFDCSWSPTAQKPPTSPPPVAESSGAGKNGKKKTLFHASTVTGRRRPAVTRRKSSQSSTTSSSMTSPRIPAEIVAPFQPELSPRMQAETTAPFQPDPSLTSPALAPTQRLPGTAPAEARPVFSPSPPAESWQDVESSDISSFRMPSVDESTEAQSFTGDQPTDWLVDKDFRSRFVDRQRQILSDINLAQSNPEGSRGAMQGGSGRDKGKGKLRQSSLGGGGQSKPSFPSKPSVPHEEEDDNDEEEEEEKEEEEEEEEEDEDEDEEEEGEDAEEEDDEDEDEDEDEEDEDERPAAPLPRTKSQLSLMIERERRASADNGKGKGKEQARKTSS